MDMDEDDDEISSLDLLRHAAGIKRKATSKAIPIPPAGKKAKIIEIVEVW